MSTTPRRPGDQTYDGLLVQDDLPAGWYLPSRFLGERPDDASGEIDALLGYDDQTVTGEEQQAQLDSEQNETVDGRWRYIEHTNTATRVFLRLQRQPYSIPEEIRITGVVYLPWRPGDPITSQLLRELAGDRVAGSPGQVDDAGDADLVGARVWLALEPEEHTSRGVGVLDVAPSAVDRLVLLGVELCLLLLTGDGLVVIAEQDVDLAAGVVGSLAGEPAW